MFIGGINAYQLDLFLLKDMGIGGILSKFVSRMNDLESGGYVGYFLPEPVATWYGSFYTDYMAYLDIADLDSVLAAQVASPGSQITIQFIALALEKAEEKAQANGETLNEYFYHCGPCGPVHSRRELRVADDQRLLQRKQWHLCCHL